MNGKPKKLRYEKGAFLHGDGRELTMSDWLGAAPEYDRFDEETDFDVVVCGGGLAGVCAARAAAEAGASVALFEKCGTIQARSGDFAVIGSKTVNERWPVAIDPDRVMKSFMRDLTYRSNYRLISRWLEENGDTFDWYLEGSPDIYFMEHSTEALPEDVTHWLQPKRWPIPEGVDGSTEYYETYPVTHHFGPSHHTTFSGNFALTEATGRLKAYFETPAKALITENGRVTGVIAESLDGKIVRANARRGVVLATGDYAGNEEMLSYYIPWSHNTWVLYTSADRNGSFANQGDGHRMAMWAGARMEEGPHAMINHGMGGLLGLAAYLQLDANGERFMNEDVPGQQTDNQLSRLPGNMSYQIFDSAWPEQVTAMAGAHGTVFGLVNDDDFKNKHQRYMARNSYIDPRRADEAVEKGEALRADTLEELVELLEISAGAKASALKSIARYNELSALGEDLDFGKKPSRLLPVSKPPFYAVKMEPAPILASLGGIECDHELRALNEDRRPIGGLYVAGNVQGSRFVMEYPMTLPGLSHSMAMTYGRIAGANAAAGI